MSFLIKYKDTLFILLSILLYFLFAYNLERTNFPKLLLLWLSLFSCFFLLMKSHNISFKNLFGIAILFRLIFLFASPNLSQDFYRFIWDGRLLFEGINPYLSLPETFIKQNQFPITDAHELYTGMGELNASHYTNYPPLNQLLFFIPALFSSKSIFGSIIILRLQILLADIGILYFGKKLLENLNLPIKKIFWYGLNPFIIIEMTGNLHFEPVMLFFLIFSLYKLHQKKWIWSSLLLACSISIKLIPLLFLPLFYQLFTKKSFKFYKNNNFISVEEQTKPFGFIKLISFYIIILATVILLFIPFYSSTLIENYTNSIGLWFRNFEFNASFYYIFREIGYLFRGYNEIAIIGKIIPILTILFLIILAFLKKIETEIQLYTAILFALCFYYFTATTMHPWYLATPLIISIFTKYKFPVVWSLVIILSYQAYANTPWQENLWIVGLEYSIVYAFMIYEIQKNLKNKVHIS
ncbi:MAG: mannosyltransferase [Polaribacter sp.]|nr:mannosyltransferase [Polaribacter sp.]